MNLLKKKYSQYITGLKQFKMSHLKVALTFLISIFLWSYSSVSAQASLAAEDMIDDIKVTTKYGKEKIYTVFRDANRRKRYYYLPPELRVAEEVVDGKVRPKMTILRYQYQDVISKETKEGGVLVASFTYAIEPECVEQVKKAIQQKHGTKNIGLSAMPLKSSKISFLSDSNIFIGDVDASKTTSDGATSASQEMIISFDLTVLGTSVFKALASSKGGIPIRANIKYNGLTPPCGFVLNGNWEGVYSHFEKNKKKEAKIGYGPFKFGGDKSSQVLKENLEEIHGMKVREVGCGGASEKDNANMQQLVDKITTEVYSKKIVTESTRLAGLTSLLESTKDEGTRKKIEKMIIKGQASLELGYQNSMKSVSKRQKGKISYDFSKQKLVERSSTFGGLLSFSKYGLDEESLLSEGYIIDVDANSDFPSVIMGLPNINPNYKLRSLVLEVSFTNSSGKTKSEARQWSETKGWVTPTGKKVEYLRFNLIGEKDKTKINEPEFDVRLQVISNIPNGSFIIQKKIKLATGEKFVDAIELLTKQIIIDGSDLDFFKITGNLTDLAIAQIELKKGKIFIRKIIKPYYRDGVSGAPDPLFILFPKDDTPETSKVTFIKNNNGEEILWSKTVKMGGNYLGNFSWKKSEEE